MWEICYALWMGKLGEEPNELSCIYLSREAAEETLEYEKKTFPYNSFMLTEEQVFKK